MPRADNNYRTQKQAITFHNKRNEVMLSMSHIFQLVKENNTEAIGSLRKDFKDYWLVISTNIIYNSSNLSAKIIHNKGSVVTKQKEISIKEIPECRPIYLKELLETNIGLKYIRALLDEPKATKKQITNFFVKLSGKKEENIRFWTSNESSRASTPVRSVELSFVDFDWFNVNGSNWFINNDGVSRGVIVESAKQTAKSRGAK